MTVGRNNLPDFDDPPVVETVLGVEFAPLEKWSVPHFGLYWQQIEADYPRFEVQPPLGSQVERYGREDRHIQAVLVELLPHFPVRCWFINNSQTRLLQVQNDRFIHNWRKVPGAEPYPHYENIRPTFEQEWTRFRAFLEAKGLGLPEVRQCEVSYINHLERGKGWQDFGELSNVLPCWSGKGSDGFLPAPETVAMSVRYPLPERHGRLHVQLQPAIRQVDRKEVLQLTLTARGHPVTSETSALLDWFDLGREWVVRGFTDFASTRMQDLWKRKKGS